jgi:hypothetical protein
MDRRQALKCAIGAAAGVALGGLPAVGNDPGVLAGSSVLADAELLAIPMSRQIPVSIIDAWLTPDGHLCTSWRFVAATLQNDCGNVATIKPYRNGALNPAVRGLKNYSRAITDENGKTDCVVFVNVPENYVANIDEVGQVTLIKTDGCDIVSGGKPNAKAFFHPIRCPSSSSQSSQREGSAA